MLVSGPLSAPFSTTAGVSKHHVIFVFRCQWTGGKIWSEWLQCRDVASFLPHFYILVVCRKS